MIPKRRMDSDRNARDSHLMDSISSVAAMLGAGKVPCERNIETVIGHLSRGQEEWARLALQAMPCRDRRKGCDMTGNCHLAMLMQRLPAAK